MFSCITVSRKFNSYKDITSISDWFDREIIRCDAKANTQMLSNIYEKIQHLPKINEFEFSKSIL